ncbi:hypothetical protein, partial [Neorhizobium alkalisoli]|uniref:hypothetical protein n=1 Tax=Neorhizobium alkalisoli TaxID=528178 RepID=UPI00197B150C
SAGMIAEQSPETKDFVCALHQCCGNKLGWRLVEMSQKFRQIRSDILCQWKDVADGCYLFPLILDRRCGSFDKSSALGC